MPRCALSNDIGYIQKQYLSPKVFGCRLTFQARYRWEIAPLSDLFVVYTRGSNLPTDSFETFQDLLVQSWTDTIVDTLAIKLRYRFGS